MRISFIITGLAIGGAESMLLKLLQNINLSRFEPSVISLSTKGEIGPCIESLGIPVHALGMKPGTPSPIRFFRLVKLLRFIRPDVVHTWMYHADFLGGLAARLASTRQVVWCIRNSDLSAERSKQTTFLVMKLCALASGWLPRRILSCSKRACLVHVAAGYHVDKMTVIPNGFDLSRFHPDLAARDSVRAELCLSSNAVLVGLIARDDPQKNHAGFVDAASRVHQALPHVHFVLAGTGIDHNHRELNRLVDEAGLSSHVHALGRRDDMPRLMASLDVLVSTSIFGEAFPNVLGEAMACGVPCVVTDVGDSAEIVGESGRVVPPSDMGALAGHIVELLTLSANERVRLGALARHRVQERYEIGSVARQYENLYETLFKR